MSLIKLNLFLSQEIMAHNISALIIKGDYDIVLAQEYDLRGIDIGFDLNPFFIDTYYTKYWQHALELTKYLRISPSDDLLVPIEEAVAFIIKEITSSDREYALIHTDYWGGEGKQFAAILKGREPISSKIETINEALTHLGVIKREEEFDEFDSVHLGNYRQSPKHLDKYYDLCDELGI